jgi:8-hydroxy-5-deazaflavin:NADPH oxidoreductase
MKIGIVGTGNVGATPARQLASLGNDIGVANSRGPETLSKLVEQTGATPAATTDTANQKQVAILRSREASSPSHPKPSRARR